MIRNIKMLLSFFYIRNIIFSFLVFTLQVNAETKIVAKSGDTLFKLSRQYGVPLKELMYKNNFNDANKLIEGETILIPLKNTDLYNEDEHITYKVMKGDTLYQIARDYNINLKDIITINNLSNNSYLETNQILLLPKGAVYKKLMSDKIDKAASKKVFYHQTKKGETLSEIAQIHKIQSQELISLNQLNHPSEIKPNTKLKIRENNVLRWLKYGSLQINWSDWRYYDGHYITQARTKKNTSFYLAVSCKKRALNNTLNNTYWKSWYFPTTDFEFKLINDFCNQDFNF